MSFVNPTGFLVGTDLSLTITNNQTGAAVLLDGRRTKFTGRANDAVLEGDAMDNGGLVDLRVIPKTWSGVLEVDRSSDDFDQLFAFMEANFRAGGTQQFFTIVDSKPNLRTGGISSYVFSGVVFHGYDPGEWSRNSITKASVNWTAQQRNSAT